MTRDNSFTENSKLQAVRLPLELREQALEKCSKEDLNFSQLMRRALRRELASNPVAATEGVPHAH